MDMTRVNNPPNVVDHDAVAQRLSDVDKVQEVLKQAARQAVVEHQRAGQKIAIWRDNQVVWEEPAAEQENRK
jgi:hypothetical protein